jgi:hypothetical protein
VAGFLQREECLDQLSECQLLKEDCSMGLINVVIHMIDL